LQHLTGPSEFKELERDCPELTPASSVCDRAIQALISEFYASASLSHDHVQQILLQVA
jgi:hypothetical protein